MMNFRGLLTVMLTATTVTTGFILPVSWRGEPGRSDSLQVYGTPASPLVDIEEVADLLEIPCRVDEGRSRLALELPLHRLLFTAGTPFVLSDDGVRQMPLPAAPPGERFLAPLRPALDLIGEFHPVRLIYDPAAPLLVVEPPRFDIFGISYILRPGRTVAEIPAAKLYECRADSTPDGGAVLRFRGGSTDSAAFAVEPPAGGLIAGARVRRWGKGVEVTLVPRPPGRFRDFTIESDPPRYLVTFAAESGGLDEESKRRLKEERSRWALDVVVIDPGHGGKDPGAIGPSRLYEKDVVLDVGLKLRDELENRGVKTIITRDRDRFIPLHVRTRIANESGGKLFISLHCNAARDRRAHGVETYFLSPAKTERAMKVALLENGVIRYEESQDQYRDLTEENFILLSMAQANFIRESEQLAEVVQNRVSAGLNSKNRGVDQAGFYVLIGASMPAVLFEMAFISNRKEEKQLKGGKFRRRIAREMADAVMAFLEQARMQGQ